MMPVDLWQTQVGDLDSEWITCPNRRIDIRFMWIPRQNRLSESMIPYDLVSRSLGADPEIHFLGSINLTGSNVLCSKVIRDIHSRPCVGQPLVVF